MDHLDHINFEALTQPSVYADELPACKGACRQGRDACRHPAACAGIEAPSLRTDLHRVELANGQTISVPKHITPTGDPLHEAGHAAVLYLCSLAAGVLCGLLVAGVL